MSSDQLLSAKLDPLEKKLDRLSQLDQKVDKLLHYVQSQQRAQIAPYQASVEATQVVLATRDGQPTHPNLALLSPDGTIQPHKKQRVSSHDRAAQLQAKRGPDGIPVYVLSTGKKDIKALWQEYTKGIDGGPAVRDLEMQYGSKWRCWSAARTAWHRHSYIYGEIERRIGVGETEEEALNNVQKMLDECTKGPREHGRGRKPGSANFVALAAKLQQAYPRGAKKVVEPVAP